MGYLDVGAFSMLKQHLDRLVYNLARQTAALSAIYVQRVCEHKFCIMHRHVEQRFEPSALNLECVGMFGSAFWETQFTKC